MGKEPGPDEPKQLEPLGYYQAVPSGSGAHQRTGDRDLKATIRAWGEGDRTQGWMGQGRTELAG